ncbi:MAG: hypothetical protein DMG05_26320 [Acidobacteria bacterium]|nr:MAG: hypothetical protein DMG05_26320 [Acidobacteriota bacterium]
MKKPGRSILRIWSFFSPWKLQRRAEALEITHQIANLADSDPDKHLRLGLLLVENQLYREAINELQEARKHLAPSFEMLYALATVYYHSDRNSDAIDVLREALQLRPNDANSYYLMARVYGALKDSRVIEALRQCVAADPAREDAWEALSQELFRREAYSQAIQIFQQYVQSSPDKAFPYILLGETFMQKHDLPNALRQFQRAVALGPNLARAHFSLGFIHKEMNQPDQAKRSLEEAVRLDPDLAIANFHLADLLSQEEVPEHALSLLKRAIQAKPDYAEAHVKLGQIYLNQKRYPEALVELLKGIELKPAAPQPRYMLARVYLGLNQEQKAAEAFKQFRELEERERLK